MQHKVDGATRSLAGGMFEVVPVPSIAEVKGLAADDTHMRMDPRILMRISDVVSILEQDYAKVLLSHVTDLEQAYTDWKSGNFDAQTSIYEIAHDIRGVAASFSRPLSGEIAARICSQLEQSPSEAGVIEDHIDALNNVANLTPEPEGAFAQAVLRRLDEPTKGSTRCD